MEFSENIGLILFSFKRQREEIANWDISEIWGLDRQLEVPNYLKVIRVVF